MEAFSRILISPLSLKSSSEDIFSTSIELSIHNTLGSVGCALVLQDSLTSYDFPLFSTGVLALPGHILVISASMPA